MTDPAKRKPPTKHKYLAKPKSIDGHNFPSTAEADRYVVLKERAAKGLIVNLELQPRFPLAVNGIVIATYVADFRYVDVERDCVVVEDVKGAMTPVYRIKKKHLKAQYGIDILEIVRGKEIRP